MGHRHHHHSDHPQVAGVGSHSRSLFLALLLTLSFAIAEAVAGWWSGSLALLGDAGHMVTDSLALGLASTAALLATRPPSVTHSYGLGRVETLAALANALLMIGLVVGISAEAVDRIMRPTPVRGAAVVGVALIGLGINIAAAWLLIGDRDNLNVRAALLHVMGDLLGSIAALLSGVVILYTGWNGIDPLLSLLIVGLILFSALHVLKEALHALMEGVPPHLDLQTIGHAMAAVEGVVSIHDLHVWSLSATRCALSAHIVITNQVDWEPVLGRLRVLLKDSFQIEHVTLQPEALVQRVNLADIAPLRPGEQP